MNRREALKAAATTSLVLAATGLAPHGVGPNAPIAAAAIAGRLLRGASQGRVLESLDRGANWQCVARLGDQCHVRKITERADILYAQVETQGYGFTLWSRDARVWRTSDARTASV